MGKHVIKTWSTTQAVVSLSKGEAEYYGIVKAASNSLRLQAIAEGMGIKLRINLFTDSKKRELQPGGG